MGKNGPGVEPGPREPSAVGLEAGTSVGGALIGLGAGEEREEGEEEGEDVSWHSGAPLATSASAGMAGAGGFKRKGTGEARTDTDGHGLTRRTLWYDVANG